MTSDRPREKLESNALDRGKNTIVKSGEERSYDLVYWSNMKKISMPETAN